MLGLSKTLVYLKQLKRRICQFDFNSDEGGMYRRNVKLKLNILSKKSKKHQNKR